MEMLDVFGGHPDLLGEIARLYERWRACGKELEELDRAGEERLRLADLRNFQRREIEAAGLTPGEDAALESERRVLQNVTRLQESAGTAYSALYDAPESALAQLRLAVRRLEEICRIDPALQEARDTLKPSEIALDEASRSLRDYLSRLEADPARLEQVESRLASLDKLKRKYGRSIEGILAYAGEVRAHLEAAETAGQRRAALDKEREELAASYRSVAAGLTSRRKEAARELARRVESELVALAMERTVFHVEIQPAEWSERGADAAAFLVSPNLGEDPRPLEKVASGGEISRIALALKTCVAAAPSAGRLRPPDHPPRTLVFDEVDAGIGGRAAETVGRRLKQLAASDQVLCVTHLPQLASFADHHFVVEKKEVDGRTVAEIRELAGSARVREIGRMLSGERLTPEALKHAEQLIRMSAAD
jgi:DNA repair protein RecN (Recombination protein N)